MPRPMKDSGVEWLGDIPADWSVVNIRKIFSFGKGLPITKEDLRESGQAVISYGQIHSKSNSGTKITKELIKFVDDNYLQSNHQSLVKRGDFIFADTSEDLAGCGNCVYVDTDNQIFAGYHTIILRNRREFHNKYFAFLFQSDAWRKQIREQVTGVKLFSISQKILRATNVLLPPLDEQQRIATFLDGECARIDSVIENTRASIVEYKKLKQAIITRAVTKGIRPNRPMKDSGIEWLGDIPADWEILKGKYLFRQRNEKGNNIELQLLSPTQKYGVIPQQMYEELSGMSAVKLDENADYSTLKSIYESDFCISLRSFQGGFEYSKYNGVVSPAYQVFYKIADLCNDYYRYMFKERGFISKMTSYTKTFRDGKNISFTDFANSLIPVPPLDEQEEIANYLDEKTAAIDSLVANKEQLLTELERLKKSLIFEYVTGKKAVPT